MGCRLRIFLTATENCTLKQLRKAANVPQRTQDRAQVLLLNARGWKKNQIAELAEKLRRSRQVQLSPDRIRRVLKKRGGFGSEQEPATGTSSIQRTKPLSKLT
jgi:hypothetical protein